MKAALIVNPTAGQRDLRADLQQAIAYLQSQGWDVAIDVTNHWGDGTRFARQAVARGCEIVVVVGGDGTLNEVVNGLVGSDVALGVLPMGTGNVWAAEMGLLPIPTPLHRPDLLAAARALVGGTTRWVDVGLVKGRRLGHGAGEPAWTPEVENLESPGERYFLLWAGVGFDALVTQLIEGPERLMKRRWGALAYGLAGLRMAGSFGSTWATLRLDDEELRARVLLVLISNVQLYAGMVRVAPAARLDDGWLDVCVFKGHGFLYILRHIVGIVTWRHLHDPEVVYRRARRVTVDAADPLPVQTDGEPVGVTPLEVTLMPRALRVIVPPGAPAGLFLPRAGDPKAVSRKEGPAAELPEEV